MLIEQKTLKQLVKNKSNIDVNKVKDILQLDPTLKVEMISDDTEIGKYGEWLLGKLYKKYDQLTNEEKNTIKSDLQFYDYQTRSKRIPQEYDNIYKIKSIKELNGIIKKLQDNNNPLTQDPVTVAIGNHQFKTVSQNPFELLKKQYYGEIKESGVTKWLVFNPKTKEESIVAGHGTSWCTSQDNSKNQWYTYIYEGNTAWIFLLSGKYKIDNPDEYNELVNKKLDKICIIVERGECKNRPDYQFELEKLPEIGKFIEDKIDSHEIKLENHDILSSRYTSGINDILTGINNKNNRLALMFKLTKEKQINQLKNRTMPQDNVIKQLEKNNIEIDKDIQLQQVTQNGYQIKYIINAGIKPIEQDVQLQQVNQHGGQIGYIINAGIKPDHDIQLQQVSNCGYQIKYIIKAGIKPDHDIQLQQVTNNEYQIEYIIDAGIRPIEQDIQLQQVKQNGYQIKYIIDAGIKPNEDVQKQQVLNDPIMISYLLYDQELFKVKDNILIQQFSKDIVFLSYAVQYQRDNKINISEKIQLQQISINAKEQIREIQTYQRLNEKQQLQQVKKDPELYNILKSPYPSQTQLYKKLKGINESTGYISKLLDVN